MTAEDSSRNDASKVLLLIGFVFVHQIVSATPATSDRRLPHRVPGSPAIDYDADGVGKPKPEPRRGAVPLTLATRPPRLAPPLKSEARSAKQGPLQIGHPRQLEHRQGKNLRPDLTWEVAADGAASTRFSVRSRGAKALRVALALRFANNVSVRFLEAAESGRVFNLETVHSSRVGSAAADAAVSPEAHDLGLYWSPVVNGDAVVVELQSPGGVPSAQEPLDIRVMQVSHLSSSLAEILYKLETTNRGSGGCNIDAACVTTRPTELSAAVTKLVFSVGGASFLCTGTLLNDVDTANEAFYVMTANHCINSQAVASSVSSFWFFKNAHCGGSLGPVIQRTGGADLLAHGAQTDFSLLELRDRVPGAYFAGWDRLPIAASSSVIGLHHPWGDVQKWSSGTVSGPTLYLDNRFRANGSHLRVVWSQGTTEPGSSGSGLFDSQGRFVGGLQGGFASCFDAADADWYGRFDLTFPMVKRWLAEVPPFVADRKTVTGSVSENQWREYRILVSDSQTRVKVELHPPPGSAFTADADLYVRRGARPNLLRQDCFSGSRMGSERCTLVNKSAQIYYIGVYGTGAGKTDYRLQVTLEPPSGPSATSRDSVGVYIPKTATYHLRDRLPPGKADDKTFRFGPRSVAVLPVTGNLGPSGQDSVAVYNPEKGWFQLRQRATRGAPKSKVRFGPEGKRGKPLLGDWNGNGQRTVGVYYVANGRFSLNFENDSGPRDRFFRFGPRGANVQPISGDWDGDGIETVGVYVASQGRFFLTNAHRFSSPGRGFRFGPVKRRMLAVAGDWDGDGIDAIGVYDPLKREFWLANGKGRRVAMRFKFALKDRGGIPVAGNWDGR